MIDFGIVMKFLLAFVVLAIVTYMLTSMEPKPAERVDSFITQIVNRISSAIGQTSASSSA